MFLPYNCTSATRELADSQLFGHRRGSFTGAVADQPGVIRTAVGGTIFLDEIGDLPLDVQPKLLRFLEQGEILPVGETRPQRVDVRVVAATNADLEQRVSRRASSARTCSTGSASSASMSRRCATAAKRSRT